MIKIILKRFRFIVSLFAVAFVVSVVASLILPLFISHNFPMGNSYLQTSILVMIVFFVASIWPIILLQDGYEYPVALKFLLLISLVLFLANPIFPHIKWVKLLTLIGGVLYFILGLFTVLIGQA